jgi:predicted MPP superfamily phosphohydrolase
MSGKVVRFALVFLLVLGGALALHAFWLEPDSLRLARYDVQLYRPGLSNMRIAVISDLHAGAPYIDQAKIERVVEMTNATKPDLVLLTGDYVITGVLGGRHMAIEEIAAHLRHLHAPLGVYAVIGNHDRWEDADHITHALQSAGIRVLENAHLVLTWQRGQIGLVGIGDYFTHASDPARALAGLPAGLPAICFTHSPDVFPELPKRCALTIAGHTHGGQVWLPLLGRPAVAAGISNYGQRYAIGLVREEQKILFVSPGIGASGVSVRFAVPPEVSLLEIR